MSYNDKSKKELSNIAKNLGLKFTSKADKKALIKLIEQHNNSKVEKEHEQQEIIQAVLDTKEEKITVQNLKDIEEARAEMIDQASDEKIIPLEIEEDKNILVDQAFRKFSVSNSNKSETTNKYDNFSSSEGYKEKVSYNQL